MQHPGARQPTLPTFDPEWKVRWDRANQLLLAMQARGEFGDDYQMYLGVQHKAYAAQFLTVEHVWAHDLRYAMFDAAGVDVPIPQLPPGASVDDAKALIARYRQSLDDARYLARRPVPADPIGVVAFTTPPRPHCRRSVEPLKLARSKAGPPVECLVVVEATAEEAHVCFIWQTDGGSVCNQIERLAAHVYWDRFAATLPKRVLNPWRCGRSYAPDRILFHEYDPWFTKTGAMRTLDSFSSIQFDWTDERGFGNPQWTHHKSVPLFLVSSVMSEVEQRGDVACSSGKPVTP